MKKHHNREIVELFHLLFLDFLGRKLDNRYYALKGGCNLRFYLKSFRYSEDIDLDVQKIPKEKLEIIVAGIFDSKPFAEVLKVRGITIEKWSDPKQTETTQRWKLMIKHVGSDLPFNTKIEFSRRGMTDETAFEAIDAGLISEYKITPIMLNHYVPAAAYSQKIEALISRSTTQARDVFDLNLLLCSGVEACLSGKSQLQRKEEAISNAMSISFDMFKSQVLSYLKPEYQHQYNSESVWDNMVLRVVAALLGEES